MTRDIIAVKTVRSARKGSRERSSSASWSKKREKEGGARDSCINKKPQVSENLGSLPGRRRHAFRAGRFKKNPQKRCQLEAGHRKGKGKPRGSGSWCLTRCWKVLEGKSRKVYLTTRKEKKKRSGSRNNSPKSEKEKREEKDRHEEEVRLGREGGELVTKEKGSHLGGGAKCSTKPIKKETQ